ncbi:MAG: hypothetical protein WCI34_05850 [Actinomycetes bacterium]
MKKIGLVLTAGLVVGAFVVQAAGGATTKYVHMRGTAYEFNSVHTMLAGALIQVDEYPAISATVGSDGKYDLSVPAKAKRVTPYITITGYRTIALQTFTMAGKDLQNVNFQVPTQSVGKYLQMMLNIPPVDPNAEFWTISDCAIVSTFNTKNVHNLDYAGFIAYGAHGVAGATAKASPKLSGLSSPIYFNDNVLPDRTKKSSSIDGGVIFTRVPSGVYTITAVHKTAKFATFKATCKPGRIVNANPPWGLYQTK